MQKKDYEYFTHQGELRVWKPKHILWKETQDCISKNFFPGIRDRKTRGLILKMETEEMLEKIDQEIKIIMRPIVKMLWSYTHDIEEAIELFDDQFSFVSAREKCINLIIVAFKFYEAKNGKETPSGRS